VCNSARGGGGAARQPGGKGKNSHFQERSYILDLEGDTLSIVVPRMCIRWKTEDGGGGEGEGFTFSSASCTSLVSRMREPRCVASWQAKAATCAAARGWRWVAWVVAGISWQAKAATCARGKAVMRGSVAAGLRPGVGTKKGKARCAGKGVGRGRRGKRPAHVSAGPVARMSIAQLGCLVVRVLTSSGDFTISESTRALAFWRLRNLLKTRCCTQQEDPTAVHSFWRILPSRMALLFLCAHLAAGSRVHVGGKGKDRPKV
jgi:hypothetical protein